MLRWSSMLLLGLLSPWVASAVEVSGQYTNLLFQSKGSLGQNQLTDLNRLRLTGKGGEGRFTWEVSYDHELLYGGLVRDPQYQLLSRLPDRTYANASAYIQRDRSLDWKHNLYRGWIQYEQENISVTVGRQRVAWGSGRIWHPTDRFNPVSPTALEMDQKLGVDAANLVWRYGGFGSVQFIVAPGKSAHNVARKTAGRWQDTFGEFDVALMGGQFGDENIVGFDLTGNLGDGGGRVELMRSTGGVDRTYTQLSAGYDYTVTSDLFPEGIYLAIEYFYNSAAPDQSNFLADRLQSLNRSLWGGQVGYDLTSLWRLDLLLLADFSHQSLFYVPRISWSMAENVDLSIFAQLVDKGDRFGEFSSSNDLYAMQLAWYF